jgi:hypothetical protein
MVSGEMGFVYSAGLVSCGVEVLITSLMRVLAFARLSMYDDGGDETGWDMELFVVLIPMRTMGWRMKGF